MSAKIQEKYFGIRVGDPRRHHCYLMVIDDQMTPRLFTQREEAQQIVNDENARDHLSDTMRTVVRVRVQSY